MGLLSTHQEAEAAYYCYCAHSIRVFDGQPVGVLIIDMGVYELGLRQLLGRMKWLRAFQLPFFLLITFFLWEHVGHTAAYVLIGGYAAVLLLWELYEKPYWAVAKNIIYGDKKDDDEDKEEESNSVDKKE